MLSSTFSPLAVSCQPASSTMDLYHDLHTMPEKHHSTDTVAHGHLQSQCSCDRNAKKQRSYRKYLLPLIFIIVVFVIITLACTTGFELFGVSAQDFVKRAVGDGTTGDGTESTFTKNKLYLVVVFVGLFVVVVLGIMLSAWCCKGSFENPLCCPCYLCACCGGLACLECIGCGLCAEGLSEA